MSVSINNAAAPLPAPQNPDAKAQPGKEGSSKFAQVRNQLKDSSGSDASSSAGVNSPSKPSASRASRQDSKVGVSDRVRQNLAVSQHHIVQLKKQLDTKPEGAAGLQTRLSSIEHQYTRLDSMAMSMPSNASPQQWLALQQQVYSMNESIGVLSKMVGQVVGGVKSVLQTQV